MRTEKVRFIAGALVGATVNFAIQSARMALDYDRPFDWSELFLCAGAGAFAGLTGFHESNALRSAFDEGGGEGIFDLPGAVDYPNHRHFFHSLISAGLIAYAISGDHTLKLSRTTRLFLWAFGISHLSHIALDCTTPKPINLL